MLLNIYLPFQWEVFGHFINFVSVNDLMLWGRHTIFCQINHTRFFGSHTTYNLCCYFINYICIHSKVEYWHVMFVISPVRPHTLQIICSNFSLCSIAIKPAKIWHYDKEEARRKLFESVLNSYCKKSEVIEMKPSLEF